MTRVHGTGALVRLAVRRDRVLIPVSVLALVALVAGSAQATLALYPDPQAIAGPLRQTLANPAIEAMYGPLTSTSLDAFATFKTTLLGAVFLALLVSAVVRRHTRAEEEDGRLELVGGTAADRAAPLSAAVLLGSVTVLATAALTALGAISVGLDPRGSFALATAWVVIGLTWVAVTAVAAQLSSTARGTAGLALGALAVAYLMRATGDIAPDGSALHLLTWLSPVGWGELVAPYGANRFWLLAPGLTVFALLLVLAFALQTRRDLGAGMVATRIGPARGRLRSPAALTLRLLRPSLIGWGIGFVVLGVVVGSLAGNVSAFIDSPDTADLLRRFGGSDGTMIDTFFATELRLAAAAAAAFGVGVTVRMGTEETSTRLEAVLATPASRVRWAMGNVTVAAASVTALMTTVAAVAGGVDSGRAGSLGGSVTRLVAAGLSTTPAAWVCVSVAVLVYGVAPRRLNLVWAALVVFVVLGEFGDLLGLPSTVTGLSPFAHLPSLPGGAFEPSTAAGLCAVAAVCTTIGVLALRRRDLPTV